MPDISTSHPSSPPFTHLRLHTEFSISDGLVTIQPLIERLQDFKMPAAAITDASNLFGLIKF
jgi:DNA polymerase-3 subunit alpha